MPKTSGRASVGCLSTQHVTNALSVRCSRSISPMEEGWWGACPALMDTAQLRQVTEELRLEMASFVSRESMWTVEARYPAID